MQSTILKIFLSFICLGLNISGIAQEGKNTITLQGDTLTEQGRQFFFSNQKDSALLYFNRAAEKFKQTAAWEKYINVLNNQIYIYYAEKRHTEFTELVFKAFDESKKYLEPNNPYAIITLEKLNTYYYTLGNFEKAIEILDEVLVLKRNNNFIKPEIAAVYHNLGNSYRFLGDHQNALDFLKKALVIRLDTISVGSTIANTYQDIGRVFQSSNHLDSVIYYFKKAENLLQPINKDNPSINKKVNNFLLLAEVWNEKGNDQKSNAYFLKAQQLPVNEYFQVKLQELLGKIFFSKKEYLAAIKALTKSQNMAEQFGKRNTPPLKARRLIELAKAYSAVNDYNNALTTYQKGLKTLSPGFSSDNYKDNPKVKEFLDKPDALKLLNEKASLLFHLYDLNKNRDYLKAAYDTYIVATNLIGDIRQGILTIDSKKALSERTASIYEGAIRTALSLFELTKSDQYKASSFTLAESNKALLLLESINEQTAKGFAGIPDSLLIKEKDLKINLAFLQNSLLEKKRNATSTNKLEAQIFKVQQQIDRLTSKFEKEYPRYFELKYQNAPIDLKTIQSILAKSNTALLEYFVGDEAIYLFILTSNGLDIQTIENPDLVFAAIQKLRPTLSQAPGTDAVSEFEQFTSNAHQLYTLLLQAAIEKIPESITGLTIIPDDQFNYIPFSILLTKPANPKTPGYSMSDLEYLMEKYPVNYHYSATLLHKSQQRKKVAFENDFIGFAPSFRTNESIASRACTSDELYSLQCSEEEVNSISNLFDGMAYTNQSATKSAFEQIASSNQIIHLATHACVDEQDANFNKIFLTDDFLSNYDLYNLELNAELAVLSACNTGSGELVKGEGVMSLARGFINAGCSSTLMSMWSVDDCATSEIMIGFYKNLKTGMKKDEALQAAKFSFINTASKTKRHPYYWAAFVPFGDMDAIEIRSSNNWWFYIIGLSLLLGRFILWKKNQS